MSTAAVEKRFVEENPKEEQAAKVVESEDVKANAEEPKNVKTSVVGAECLQANSLEVENENASTSESKSAAAMGVEAVAEKLVDDGTSKTVQTIEAPVQAKGEQGAPKGQGSTKDQAEPTGSVMVATEIQNQPEAENVEQRPQPSKDEQKPDA